MVNSRVLNTTNILVIAHSSRCDRNVSRTTGILLLSTDFKVINLRV